MAINNLNYPRTRKLIDIPKLLAKYNVQNIHITYPHDDKLQSLEIPIHIELLIMLKCYISIDVETDEIYVARNLRGGANYWLTQILDDHKNKRIDLREYTI